MYTSPSASTYLKGLTSLRFFAALLVLIFHCDDAFRQVAPEHFLQWGFLEKGLLAVDFFFILSGFLLTYLACHEFNNTGSFNLLAFYKRRILRIFPLYYLAVAIGFITIGLIYPIIYKDIFFPFEINEGLLYYIFFLPNWAAVKWLEVGPIYGLWSIGVEEQFYLLFPLLVVLPLRKHRLITGLVLSFLLYLVFHLSITRHYILVPEFWYRLVFETLRFHFMLWGCLLGALYYNHKSIFETILSPYIIQIVIFFCMFFVIIDHVEAWDPYYLFSCFIFSLIMILVTLEKSILKIDYPLLQYLGTISFGIYIFHPYLSVATRYLMQINPTLNNFILSFPIVFYVIVFSTTVLIAHLSYTYYESYFLKKKRK